MGAAQDQLRRMTAIAMGDFDGWTVGVSMRAVTPLHQRDDRGQQLETFLGKAIFVAFALAEFLVWLALHHSRVSQGAGHVLGDAEKGRGYAQQRLAARRSASV